MFIFEQFQRGNRLGASHPGDVADGVVASGAFGREWLRNGG